MDPGAPFPCPRDDSPRGPHRAPAHRQEEDPDPGLLAAHLLTPKPSPFPGSRGSYIRLSPPPGVPTLEFCSSSSPLPHPVNAWLRLTLECSWQSQRGERPRPGQRGGGSEGTGAPGRPHPHPPLPAPTQASPREKGQIAVKGVTEHAAQTRERWVPQACKLQLNPHPMQRGGLGSQPPHLLGKGVPQGSSSV